MSVFISTPYNLVANTVINAQVQALNAIGWGATSPDSTGAAIVETVPLQMTTVTRDNT